jgi:hypothetical protein
MEKLLQKKWQDRTIGHFYILQGEEKALRATMENFLKGLSLNPHHPDILFLDKDADKKNYTLEGDLRDFFEFLRFSPLELFKKIAIFPDAHLLSAEILNKILRILEDLDETVLFFLNPTQIPFLPTIESRAITFRAGSTNLPGFKKFYQDEEFASWPLLLELPLQTRQSLIDLLTNFDNSLPFLEKLGEQRELQQKVFDLLLSWERDHLTTYRQKEKFLNEIKRFQTSLLFNNPYKERFFSLLFASKLSILAR